MNTPRDEHDLHDERISALYRELPDESPSADSDALIRAAARRAASAGPRKQHFSARLQGLLATAATLVLGVALLMQWRSEPQHLQEVLATAPQAPVPASAEEEDRDNDVGKTEAAAQALPDKKPVARPATVAPARLDDSRDVAAASSEAAAPAEMNVDESRNRAREMAAHALQKKSLDAGRQKEERLAATPPQQEASRSSARREEYPPAPVAATPASISAGIGLQADAGAAKASSVNLLLPYQQAMQAGLWAQAEAALGTLPADAPLQQRLDHDLLTLAQGKGQPTSCHSLPAGTSAGDALLCRFMTLHSEGKALPADALAQLEKSGALSSQTTYRRSAILKLLE